MAIAPRKMEDSLTVALALVVVQEEADESPWVASCFLQDPPRLLKLRKCSEVVDA